MINQQTFKAWFQASRAPFFVATIIPLALGGILAYKDNEWNWITWLAVLLASFFVHLCTNLANDYFEYFSGADDNDSIGGSRVLQEGKITMGQIKVAMIIMYSLALLLGLWILWTSRIWWLTGVMIFAFFSSVYYIAPPIRYGYHGLGELMVGINMGPIMVAGTYTALTGSFSWSAAAISIPVGLMVAMILFYQSLPDIETDKTVGKNTLAVILGRKKSMDAFIGLTVLVPVSIVLLVWLELIHPLGLFSILSSALSFKILRMIQNTNEWQDLHGRGGKVRLYYLINGIILITSVIMQS